MPKLTTGDQMPNLDFSTHTRKDLSMEAALGGRRTIFWVLRYIGCTTCRYDVHLLSQRYEEFAARDTQVYVVMQSDPAVVVEDLNGQQLPFEIICDTDMNVYKTLAIPAAKDVDELLPKASTEDAARWDAKCAVFDAAGFVHGKFEGDEMQLPAFFLVSADGMIEVAHYAENIVDMPTIDTMLAMLDN